MLPAPTQRQREIAAFLESELRSCGMMPTQREIAARFGFSSPNAVRTHLRLMEQKGMITRLPGKARALKLKCGISEGIPVLGRIAAGHPQMALEDADEVVPVSPQFFCGTDLFGLRVKGESMKDVGILSGDIAVMNRQQDVEDGEIAAVLLDDDATLKFLHRRHQGVVLRGANPAFADIVVRIDEMGSFRILGKYVGLIRQQRGAA